MLAQEAIDFIDEHHQRNLTYGTTTPFFLYYASQSAHGPYTPPDTLLGEPVDKVTGLGTHSDMKYEIDVALGKLIDALDERGLTNDTLIIFVSDNGGLTTVKELEAGHDAVGGLRGKKGLVWEGGHRIPFVARWGDSTSESSHIPPGSVRHQLVGAHDLMASLAALVGTDLPFEQARDSYNILPVLLGTQPDSAPVRDHIISQADVGEGVWAYREAEWKLVLDADFRATDLYNLSTDLVENDNLIGDPEHDVRVAGMLNRFVLHRGSDRTAPELSP